MQEIVYLQVFNYKILRIYYYNKSYYNIYMGGLFSVLSSGSVPKELKDYIIQNPTIEKIRSMSSNSIYYFLKFTDGDKDPQFMFERTVIDEIKNSNNSSKDKYIGLRGQTRVEPNNIKIDEYKKKLFIYYDTQIEEFKILTKFKEYISDDDNIFYKFENDSAKYFRRTVYMVEKPKKNNNQKGGSKKKYKNNKKIIKNKKYLLKSSKYNY